MTATAECPSPATDSTSPGDTPAPKPTAASAVQLLGISHHNDRSRARYSIVAEWSAPFDRGAANELVREPIARQLREMSLDSVARYKELVQDQAAIHKRLAMAQAVHAEQTATRNRLTLEGRAGTAAELVKLGKAIVAAEQDIRTAEQERDIIAPLVTAAHEQARGELGRIENQAVRSRRAEIDAQHVQIVDEITALIAEKLVALKRLSCAVSDTVASVGEVVLRDIEREARQ